MLSLSFFGAFDARLNGETIRGFESSKVRALLAYLVMEADRPHSRDHLAGLFWGESSGESAAKNLRQALSNLRKAIRDDEMETPLLTAASDSIRADASSLRLDALEFASLLSACETHPHYKLETCTACSKRMQDALSLYQGAFLQGFFLKEAAVYQDWVAVWRERFHQMAADALQSLIAHLSLRGEVRNAIVHAQKLVALDPWREEAHALLMELFARDGQRSAALRQYEQCCSVLKRELGVAPLASTTALYETIRNGTLLPAPAPTPPLRLPGETTAFVGRTRELDLLADRLQYRDSRLLTLTGLGGSGKTRLAIHSARRERFAFPDGVYFVELISLSSPASLPQAIAEAVDFAPDHAGDLRAALLERLREKRMLIVLDNFEHLIEGSDFIVQSVRACPALVFLVTSREPLHLQAEWTLEIKGLDASPPDPKADSPSPASDALRLFEERARRALPKFELNEETLPRARDLCALLNGLPLGIEIAAALLKTHSLEGINARIQHNLDFLSVDYRDMPERHRSLRAVFDHSLDLIPEPARRALAELSIFQGEFSRETAQAVCLAGADQLALLADNSLLQFGEGDGYSMHELVRQYCVRLPHFSDGAEEAILRFVSHFADFVSRRETSLSGDGQKQAVADLGKNIHHVRQAWRWAGERQMVDRLNQMFRGLHYYYDLRGWFAEGEALFGEEAARLSRRVESREELTLLGKLFAAQGWFNFRMGNAEKARAMLDGHADLFKLLQSGPDSAFILNYLGLMEFEQNRYPEARAYLEESLRLQRAANNRAEIAKTLNNLGLTLQRLGRLEDAILLFQESADLRREIGNLRGVSISSTNLGVAYSVIGEWEKARAIFETCLAMDTELGDQYGIVVSMMNLGKAAIHNGQLENAERYLKDALSGARGMGERPLVSKILLSLSELHRSQLQIPRSLGFLREGHRLARETNSESAMTAVLLEAAEVAAIKQQFIFAAELAGYITANLALDAENKKQHADLIARLGAQLSKTALAAHLQTGAAGGFESDAAFTALLERLE